MDNHYLSLVLAYIVLYTQSAGNNGHMRQVQIYSCKKLLTRCTARPGMRRYHTHPCFVCVCVCVCFTYHSYGMLRQLVAGLSSVSSGFNPVAVFLGFVVDSLALG